MRKTPKTRKSETKIQQNTQKQPGRPRKDVSVTEAIRAYIVKNPDVMQQIVRAWLDAIKNKNMMALTELLNRLEGKVIERHEVENKQAVTLIFTPAVEPNQLPPGDVIEGEFKEIKPSESQAHA